MTSLEAWLNRTNLPIIFVENSNDRVFINHLRSHVASTSQASRIDIIEGGPSTTCEASEIGCHEASAIFNGVQRSVFFGPTALSATPRCTFVVKVTGRYFVHDLERALMHCPAKTILAVQNPAASIAYSRQESIVIGFDVRSNKRLFGWCQRGELCQECHLGAIVERMRAAPKRSPRGPRGLCVLPLLAVDPVHEGTSGLLRTSV